MECVLPCRLLAHSAHPSHLARASRQALAACLHSPLSQRCVVAGQCTRPEERWNIFGTTNPSLATLEDFIPGYLFCPFELPPGGVAALAATFALPPLPPHQPLWQQQQTPPPSSSASAPQPPPSSAAQQPLSPPPPPPQARGSRATPPSSTAGGAGPSSAAAAAGPPPSAPPPPWAPHQPQQPVTPWVTAHQLASLPLEQQQQIQQQIQQPLPAAAFLPPPHIVDEMEELQHQAAMAASAQMHSQLMLIKQVQENSEMAARMRAMNDEMDQMKEMLRRGQASWTSHNRTCTPTTVSKPSPQPSYTGAFQQLQ